MCSRWRRAMQAQLHSNMQCIGAPYAGLCLRRGLEAYVRESDAVSPSMHACKTL